MSRYVVLALRTAGLLGMSRGPVNHDLWTRLIDAFRWAEDCRGFYDRTDFEVVDGE